MRYPLLQRSMITSWPPRSRTERFRLIRAAPSTGWVVASTSSIDLAEESGGLEPQRFIRPSAFGAAPASLAGSLSAGAGRGRRTRIPALSRPPGFRPGPAAWLVHPPRKVADSNGTVLPAHPLATEPGPCPVHLPYAGRESNPHVRRHTLLGRARLPFTPPALGPADCAGVGEDLGVLGGSRTRNRRLLKPTSLPELEYEHVSRRPVPTRVVRRTKAEPQPCAAASLPPVDLNQDFRNQSPASCQLDEEALGAYAAGDSNPEHTD